VNCALCGADDAEQEAGLCPACDRLSSFFTRTLGGPDRTAEHATGPAGDLPPPGARFAPGHSFGDRYTVVEQVGAGGMGQVYKAIDRQLNRTVALKLVRPGLQARVGALQRFRRELVLAQQVSHPNVCRVHDLGEVEGVLYITMEFVTGQTLDDLIRAMGHLSPRQTIAIGRQVCAGLQAIHAQSIVHRDLKPGNIMLDRGGHAVVMDFGMAHHHGDDRLTSEGSVLGTLAYLSPEHARGHTTDVRSDIYALGVIFYEMLSGRRPPGDGGPLPLALREASERCPPPSQFIPEVPAVLDALVLRCLQRDPGRRWTSAGELEQAFTHAAAALSTTLIPAAVTTSITRPFGAGRSRLGAITAGVVAVLVLVGVAATLLRKSPPIVARPRLAVALLPLAYDGEGDSSWLKDLVPKGVGDSLRAYPGLEVVPFGSSHAYEAADDPKTVAAQLGVDAVVRGSIRVREQKVETELRGWRGDGADVRPVRVESAVDKVFGQNATLAAQLVEALGVRTERPSVAARDPEALAAYLKGQSYLEGWDVDANDAKAEEAFRSALRRDDGFAEAHAGLAAALWRRFVQTNDAPLVERAHSEAQRAVALAPNLPEAHLALGITLLGRGRSAEAAAAFAEARRLAPGDDAACRQMARAYFRLKRNAEAEKLYQQAIDLRPQYWENYNAKAAFYVRTGRHQEAKDLYGKVIELRPLSIAAFNNKAAVHMLDGEFKAAEPLLRAALQLGPSFEVRTNLGFVLYAQGRYDEASEEYRRAVEGGGARAETYGSLGDAYRQAGKTAAAREAYDKAIAQAESRLEVNPDDSDLRGALAWFRAGARDCPAAHREAERAVAGPGVEGTTHYYAAVAFALCTDRVKAVRETLRALDGGVEADVRTSPDLRVVRSDPEVDRRLRAKATP
jgi:serine/threonine protein kinase/tetratricopeptide (TPR) repeat protein